MSDHPEMPYLAAAGVAYVGATIRDGKLPDITTPAIGVVALVIITSATADSRYAPLVRAFGYLLLTSALIAATNATLKRAKKRKVK